MTETKIHLTEEILGNKAVCYHRTPFHLERYPNYKNPVTGKINKNYKPTWQDVQKFEPIIQAWSHTGNGWGFHTGGGDCYGPGMYSTFRDPRQNTQTKGYGAIILKFGVSNISNYLFVDFDEFTKTPKYKENPKKYNRDTYIVQQMLDAGVPLKLIASLESKCSLSTCSGQEIVEKYGRPQFAWRFSPYFLGFVYTGGHNDGDVLVTFDPEEISKKYGRTSMSSDAGFMTDEENAAELERTKAALEFRKDNVRSIYPLGFSIDDGNTYHPVPVCEPLRQKIHKICNDWSYSSIMVSKGKSDVIRNPASILEAYTEGNKFNVPFFLISMSLVKEQAAIDYIAKHNLDIAISDQGSSEYYNTVDRIIDALQPKGIIVNFTNTVFKDANIKPEFINIINKIPKIFINNKGTAFMPFYVTVPNSPLITLLQKNISKFKVLDKLLIGPGQLDQFANANIQTRLVFVDVTERNLAAAKNYFRGAKIAVSTDVSLSYAQYNHDLISITADSLVQKIAKLLKNADDSESIMGFATGTSLSIRSEAALSKLNHWAGTVEYLPTMYYDTCQLDTYKYIKQKSDKLIMNKLVISPVKDQIVSRKISEFPADDTTGIRNLSVIGPIELMGSGVTGVMRLGCDITAFNCLKDHVKVFEYLGVYLPEQDNKYTVTEELVADLKRVAQKDAAVFIYSRGSEYLDGDQLDLSQLDPGMATWVKQHRQAYSAKIFSKYIDIQKDLTEMPKELSIKDADSELLDEVASDVE